VGALVALLDLTTSAVPSFIDVFGPVPATPWPVRAVEVLLLGLGLPGWRRALAPLPGALRSLPGSRVGLLLMAVYLLGASAAVVLRTELFPFSNVGMFSAVPARPVDMDEPRREASVVLVSPAGVQPISVLREGTAFAADFDTGWDYKAGWVMYMFGTADSHALAEATRVARLHGAQRAVRALVRVDPRTGKVLAVEPWGRR
jgi:hypothetical protein